MKVLKLAALTLLSLFMVYSPAKAEEASARIQATVLIASNEGSDFDLTNDAYRDELIKLFSYSAYHQMDQFDRVLNKSAREKIDLEGGYELLGKYFPVGDDDGIVASVRAERRNCLLVERAGREYGDTLREREALHLRGREREAAPLRSVWRGYDGGGDEAACDEDRERVARDFWRAEIKKIMRVLHVGCG